MLKVVFKKADGDILTTYEEVSRISLEEMTATKELLEYENNFNVEVYVVTDFEN